MKKVFSILVALALVLGMSIVATPVLADVTAADVLVGNPIVNEVSEYTITFNITATLGVGQTVSVEFPTNTVVPGTYAGGAVTVQGTGIAPGDISGSNRVVTIWLPISITVPPAGSTEVEVVFTTAAGIKNPTTAKDYTLMVRTSRETNWVTSKKYGISLAPNSTYEFLYDSPALISKDFPAEVDVTLQTKVLGSAGYAQARIDFALGSGTQPGTVLFSVKDGETWSTPAATGSYPHTGTFVLGADHNEMIQFRITFSEVGVYTLSFKLVDTTGPSDLVVDAPAFTCAGVSATVVLNKGWNLVSLPIIPVNADITAVLADIMEDGDVKVESVWYYNPTITDPNKRWQSYVPGGPTPTLTTIEDGKAYWINVKEATSFTFAGVAIVLPGQLPPTYSVREGWNMIGFKSRVAMAVKDYLAGTKWVRVLEFKNGVWTILLEGGMMTPGLGYWVAFSEPGTVYP
jgi:hypothetical protein